MKQTWQPEELVEHWTLLGDELVLLEGKNTPSRLVFALLLKFFQLYARFPEQKAEIPQSVIDYVASQLRVGSENYASFDWQGRTLKRHRVEIRHFLGFRTFQVKDGKALTAWLQTQLLAYELKIESLKLAAKQHLRALKIEPPTPERLERLVRSAIRSFEEEFCQNIASQLSLPIRQRLDALLTASWSEPIEGDNQTVVTASLLAQLKTDPGRLGLDSLQKEAAKLEQLRQLELPEQLSGQVGAKVLETYKQRVAVEAPSQLRRHPDHKRYTLLAAFCWLRSREITDNLVELLIQIVHRIGARAQRRVEKELLNDFKKVSGKTGLLFQLAEAALDKPEGVVKEVIYPIVGEQTLKHLVREFKSTGTAYREKVYTVMRSSYSNHYRRIVPILLSLLEFRSNNDIHRPVIEALELLKKYKDSKQRYYASSEEVPIEGIIRSSWQELIIEQQEDSSIRINRINYELAVLQALRDGLRCKEIWVVGASRYRNPDQDLPTDFEENREVYYQALSQPTNIDKFITNLQEQMLESLAKLDQRMPKNQEVQILQKSNGWIRLSPFEPSPEPINLDRLKTEAEVVNATFEIRQPHIWGEGTTTCASDSKKFGAWDQNLMTEWHIRYGGRGVMIYWHVEKNSACIYSQLKTCSSSLGGGDD